MRAATVLSIGTFDGVHRGHQALLGKARQIAGSTGRVIVLSFDPHPLTTLRPDMAPARLTTFGRRRSLLLDSGADQVQRLEPDRELLALTAEQFVDQLQEQYAPSAFVEGPDFRFGRGRQGSVETLAQLGGARGFEVHVIEAMHCTLTDRSVVRASSSLLRWMLRHGRVRDAAAICDRRFEVVGTVVSGDRRGRELGWPTANLQVAEDILLPHDGIYGGEGVLPDGTRYPAAISIGTKPTFGQRPRTCEAHLIGFDGPVDDYNWTLGLQFSDWIRDQVRFDGAAPLIEQIRRDCADAVTIAGHMNAAATNA